MRTKSPPLTLRVWAADLGDWMGPAPMSHLWICHDSLADYFEIPPDYQARTLTLVSSSYRITGCITVYPLEYFRLHIGRHRSIGIYPNLHRWLEKVSRGKEKVYGWLEWGPPQKRETR